MHVKLSKQKRRMTDFLQSIMRRALSVSKTQAFAACFAHIIPESEESDMKACGQVF